MIHNICKYGVFALTTVLIGVSLSFALGSLIPIGTPSAGIHYTLKDIYHKLTTGATTTLASGDLIIPDFEASFPTLTEIYAAIPNDAVISTSTTEATITAGILRATTTIELAPITEFLKYGLAEDFYFVNGDYGGLVNPCFYLTKGSQNGEDGEVAGGTWHTASLAEIYAMISALSDDTCTIPDSCQQISNLIGNEFPEFQASSAYWAQRGAQAGWVWKTTDDGFGIIPTLQSSQIGAGMVCARY
jgi:hypothetical protein